MNPDESVIINKGKGLKRNKNNTELKKIFVFDLDETIGSFSELYNIFKYFEYLQQKEDIQLFHNDEDMLFQL